jgi:hypothetical protein
MTRDEFEVAYAARSGLTVERLHELGQYAYPCRCDFEHCPGWAMLSTEEIERQEELCGDTRPGEGPTLQTRA